MKQHGQTERNRGIILFLVISCALPAFIWPLLNAPRPGSAALNRYATLYDGQTGLYVIEDAGGRVQGWFCYNVSLIPIMAAVNEIPSPFFLSLLDHYGESFFNDIFDHRAAQFYRVSKKRFDAEGNLLSGRKTFNLRTDEGDLKLGFIDHFSKDLFLNDPPLFFLRGEQLKEGGEWFYEGRFNLYGWPHADEQSQRLSMRVSEAECFETAAGADCLIVVYSRELEDDNLSPIFYEEHVYYDPGRGLVRLERFQDGDSIGDDALLERYRLVSGTAMKLAENAPLPPAPVPLQAEGKAPVAVDAEWQLKFFSDGAAGGARYSNNMPVSWIPGYPPLLLTASPRGELRAINAESGEVEWLFKTGGHYLGPPAYDESSGMIYVGASDKMLYALDRRGLFLWAYKTRDNIPTRPLVIGDHLVIGSEDGRVYILDKTGGRLKETLISGGPVGASPVEAAGLAVIGSYDGAVYGLDPANPGAHWKFVTGKALEAPLAAADSRVYIAGQDGYLYALCAAEGRQQWRCRIGPPLRSKPALDSDQLYIIDSYGYLHGIEKESGRLLWTTRENRYSGAPLAVKEGLLALSSDGSLLWMDQAGRLIKEWENATRDHASPGGSYLFGPESGNEEIWLLDSNSAIHRLGPGR